MKLTRLVIENFGPYFGKFDIDLTVTPEAPVILIYGENERGKTSFANAIRWCLYGDAYGRGGVRIPTVGLLNAKAKEGGTYNMSVTLGFEHASATYELERHVQADRAPADDRDLTLHLSLRRNGSFVPKGEIDRLIRDILHPDISRFFLFDGEMLNEYEILLRDPTRSTETVRSSIEQILGLPALRLAATSLEEMRRGAERRQLREAQTRGRNEQLIASAQQKEEALNALREDIARHRDLRLRLDREMEQARQRLVQFADLEADFRQLDRLESEVKRMDAEATEKVEEIRSLLKAAWWLPLEGVLRRESDDAERDASESTARASRIQDLRRSLEELVSTKDSHACSLCGQKVGGSDLDRLGERLTGIRDEIQTLDGKGSDPTAALERMRRLRPFAGSTYSALLREKETTLRRLRIQRRRTLAEVEEIRERVRTDSREEIREMERDLEQHIKMAANLDELLRDALQRQQETSAALQNIQKAIRALPDANRQLAIEAEVFGALQLLFDLGVAKFRDKLREVVEKEASDIHQNISPESGYGGLRINDQYGLTLVKRTGTVVPYRSAASEQTVALSLIGALNRSATREGPIVMDTPFGRLDRTRRRRFLEFAPKFGPQVLLLVQSGEMERDRDLEFLGGRVAHEYEIVRDGDTDLSKIIPLSN